MKLIHYFWIFAFSVFIYTCADMQKSKLELNLKSTIRLYNDSIRFTNLMRKFRHHLEENTDRLWSNYLISLTYIADAVNIVFFIVMVTIIELFVGIPVRLAAAIMLTLTDFNPFSYVFAPSNATREGIWEPQQIWLLSDQTGPQGVAGTDGFCEK